MKAGGIEVRFEVCEVNVVEPLDRLEFQDDVLPHDKVNSGLAHKLPSKVMLMGT